MNRPEVNWRVNSIRRDDDDCEDDDDGDDDDGDGYETPLVLRNPK